MNMAMSQQIVQTKSHHLVHLQDTEIPIQMPDIAIDLHLTMIIKTDIDLTGQDPTPAAIDTGVTIRVIHEEVTAGHITDAHIEPHHATETQVHITINKTPYIEDPHHTKVFPEIAVDPDHVHHTETTAQHHLNHPTAPTGQPGKTRRGNINKSPLMTCHPNITALMNHPANQTRI